MKKFFLLIIIAFFTGFKPPAPADDDDDFCTVFFRIIKSAVENDFENIKGQSLGETIRGYNKIEKWKSIENLPTGSNPIISKSFGTSYLCTMGTAKEIDDNIMKLYDQWAYTIDDCLSPAWQIYEVPKDGFYKKMSVSRRDASEVLKFPNINLEINKVDDNYCLQLKIIK